MEQSLDSDLPKFSCLFCNVSIPERLISTHLSYYGNHKIVKIEQPPPPEDFRRAIVDKINSLVKIQIQIQQSSASLIQSILSNTQIILSKLDKIIRLYKDISLVIPIRLQENESQYVSNFRVNNTLNTALTDHFEQKILDKSWIVERKTKKIKSKISKIFENKCDSFFSMIVSNNEEFIVTGGQTGILRIWELENNTQTHRFKKHKGSVEALAISFDDSIMLSGSNDCTVKLWDLRSNSHLHTFKGHNHYVTSVLISVDKKTGFSGSKDGSIKIWNLETMQLEKTKSEHSSINEISLYNKENLIVSAGSLGLTFWSLESEEYTQVSKEIINTIAFTKDEKYFITGNSNGDIRIFVSRTCKIIFEDNTVHSNEVKKIAFTHCSKYFATCSYIRKVFIWDFREKKVVHTLELKNYATNILFIKKNNTLVLGQLKYPIILFHILKTEEIQEKINPKMLFLQAIAISSDLKYMAYGCSNLKIIEIDTEKKVNKIACDEFCTFLKFSPDNCFLGMGFDSGKILISKFPCSEILHSFHFNESRVVSLSFSMNNNILACGFDDSIFVALDIEKNEKVYSDENFYTLSSVFCYKDKRLVILNSEGIIHVVYKNFTKVVIVESDNYFFRLLVAKNDRDVILSDCQSICSCVDAATFEKKYYDEKIKDRKLMEIEDSKLQVFMSLPRVNIS